MKETRYRSKLKRQIMAYTDTQACSTVALQVVVVKQQQCYATAMRICTKDTPVTQYMRIPSASFMFEEAPGLRCNIQKLSARPDWC
jgi:hypothetical protein